MNIKQFQTFVQNFRKMGKNPQAVVQELLNSGQMSQAQFNELAQKVNQMMGQKAF